MIKTIVTPQTNHVDLAIPNNYLGKELEILVYARDEVSSEKEDGPRNAARFKGLLTKAEGEMYHQYLKQARSEWDRDI